MPAPSPSRICTHTTRAGRPCRAWAIRDTEPAACAAHAGRIDGAGAPEGNQNARKHGFYARTLSHDEIADLIACAADPNLDAEIACTRVALRRAFDFLSADPEHLAATDRVRACALVFQGARTIARLLREKHALVGDAADRFDEATSQALDILSAEWGIDL